MHSHHIHDYNNEPHQEVARQAFSDQIKKLIQSALNEMVDAELSHIEDNCAEHISRVASDRACAFVEKVLSGDDKAAEALFECGADSRFRTLGPDKGEPWAQLIHGRLFATNAMELRKKLVEAHPDLLRNERIADLDSIVVGLENQIRKQDAEIARLRERLS